MKRISILMCVAVLVMGSGIPQAQEFKKEYIQIKVSASPLCRLSKPNQAGFLDMYFAPEYGLKFGLTIEDTQENKRCVSGLVFQEIVERQIIKGFAGVPFILRKMESDGRIELKEPLHIKIQKGPFKWQNKTSNIPEGKLAFNRTGKMLPGNLYIDVCENTEYTFFASLGSGIISNETVDLILTERHLKKPKIIENLEGPLIVPTEDSVIPFECDSEFAFTANRIIQITCSFGVPKRVVPNAIGVIWHFDKGSKVTIGKELFEAEIEDATIEFKKEGPILKGIKRSYTHQKIQ